MEMKITMNLDNSAFRNEDGTVFSGEIRAEKIGHEQYGPRTTPNRTSVLHGPYCTIQDSNGNRVGEVSFEED